MSPVKNGGMENHEKKTLTHPEELQQPQERQRKRASARNPITGNPRYKINTATEIKL